MPSDIVALPATNTEALKQWLNALVVAIDAAEEKATTACRCFLAARQLLDEEQDAAADLQWQAATKKPVHRSMSFSTTKTTTASSSYVNTIIANLHIQANTMMEAIHLDTSCPSAALTAFYSNKMLSAPLSPPHPPDKNNGSSPDNSNGSNNNRRNGGSGGKNNDNGGNRSGNTSSNTTVVSHDATTNDGRGPPPWTMYANLS
jgi:hypothetical protein